MVRLGLQVYQPHGRNVVGSSFAIALVHWKEERVGSSQKWEGDRGQGLMKDIRNMEKANSLPRRRHHPFTVLTPSTSSTTSPTSLDDVDAGPVSTESSMPNPSPLATYTQQPIHHLGFNALHLPSPSSRQVSHSVPLSPHSFPSVARPKSFHRRRSVIKTASTMISRPSRPHRPSDSFRHLTSQGHASLTYPHRVPS